jgi:(2R)-3-sulfolactate dehydrogenase (NADP+)
MAQISVVNIFSLSKAALLKFGALDWIADAVADAIAKSESVGNRICGLYYLESYCMQLNRAELRVMLSRLSQKKKVDSHC